MLVNEKTVGKWIAFVFVLVLAASQTGCGTWEVKFGMSEYNGSSEARTFKASEERK